MSKTRWRDEPIIPAPRDYEDIAKLVGLARKTRGRTVKFEWVFPREDLLSLRRAAFEWGSPVVGVYKGFDARVLAATKTKAEASIAAVEQAQAIARSLA